MSRTEETLSQRPTTFKPQPYKFSPRCEVRRPIHPRRHDFRFAQGSGFSGRINFLTGAPDDVASTLNCIYNLLQKLHHEQFLKEEAQAEYKRLRNEALSYEQNLSRLRKDIDVKERDIATLKIRGRQGVDRHAEELAILVRDRDALQKQCNDLTRRQVQFQHEIRRKELLYDWLQEKLRNYLAERKRESSASMEIVGLLRQQSPQPQKDKNKIVSRVDNMMPGRNGNAKKSSNRGPKLDETMVKMIVTAYEEKQKELMAENEDLQEALNGIRKEYTDLMNAQMEKAEMQSKSLSRMDSKIYTTKRDSLESQSAVEGMRLSPSPLPQGSSKSGSPSALQGPSSDPATPSEGREVAKLLHSEEKDEEPLPNEEDIRRKAELPDGELNADCPDLVPWPDQTGVQLKPTGVEPDWGEKGGQPILEMGESTPVLPTVLEELETMDSVKEDETPSMDPSLLAGQTDLVLTTLSGRDQKCDAEEGESPETVKSKGSKFVWPPPSSSPPREEPMSRPVRSALGKLPQPSNKPVPNAAFLSEEQLKQELRTRAVDVEEAVRALKTACTSMQPQHMRSVMEKRLHMELTMAANLAEQQEAVVNLALAGLEKARRAGVGTELEEMSASVETSLKKAESIISEMMQNVKAAELQSQLQTIRQEFLELREKTVHRSQSLDPALSLSGEEFDRSISSLRGRADALTKKKEQINKARGTLDDDPAAAPGRRTWAEKEKESLEGCSDDESVATLSRILHASD